MSFMRFIHYIADPIGSLHIFRFSLSDTYIFDQKEEHTWCINHMSHAKSHPHLCTRLHFFGHAFFSTSKMDINLSRWEVFHMPRRSANVLELRTPKWMFYLDISQSFRRNKFFKMLMNGFSKNWNTFFLYATPMDVSRWMKEHHREMSNCSKVIMVPNKSAQELCWS